MIRRAQFDPARCNHVTVKDAVSHDLGTNGTTACGSSRRLSEFVLRQPIRDAHDTETQQRAGSAPSFRYVIGVTLPHDCGEQPDCNRIFVRSPNTSMNRWRKTSSQQNPSLAINTARVVCRLSKHHQASRWYVPASAPSV